MCQINLLNSKIRYSFDRANELVVKMVKYRKMEKICMLKVGYFQHACFPHFTSTHIIMRCRDSRPTCWQIDISVGVRALLSGVVPKNLIIHIGFAPLNHSVEVSPADLANNDVFPQPPSPYKTIGFSESPFM